MKTKFRILTILFLIGLLSTFGFICAILDIKVFENAVLEEKVVFIFISILNLLLLAGLVSMIILTKTINFSNDKITVNYIFRFKKTTYEISELIGFTWDTLKGAVHYKRITIWFSGNQRLRFSDFEVGNFYLIESYLLHKTRICRIGGKIANVEQINSEIEKNRKVDLNQIKRIKYTLIFLWTLIGFIFYLIAADLLNSSGLQRHKIILLSISIVILILSLMKFFKENKRKDKITSSAQQCTKITAEIALI